MSIKICECKKHSNMPTSKIKFETQSPLEKPEIKSGIMTTEFWQTILATIITNIITILVIFKAIPEEKASILATALVAICNSVVTVYMAIKYNQYRCEVKKAFLNSYNH